MVTTRYLVCFYSNALDMKLFKALNTAFKVLITNPVRRFK